MFYSFLSDGKNILLFLDLKGGFMVRLKELIVSFLCDVQKEKF